ncbi:cytidylyltransferase [Purpureocillium lilacinum]|uniref:Cytidylyltransferase n=1 Tax=Purpureocillium lilacinum TaxID=33203 RepID=A0A179GQG7_PURLI|nr:cytidylyltransferase [Purpureocillium lilacinum]
MSQAPPPPSMRPNPGQLVDFFARSLTAFQSSRDPLRVLCTLPHSSASATSTRVASSSSAVDAEPAPRRPSGPVRRLIVLDSSFNPPTRAHAQMVRSAVRDAKGGEARASGATRVMLLLAVNNADKAPKPASFPVRLCMMEGFARELLGDEAGREASTVLGARGAHANEDGAGLKVDLALTTMPYFHDKARAIHASGFYGGAHDAPEQVFLAGYDTLIRIFNPKYYGGGEAAGTTAADRHNKEETAMQAALDPFFATARLRVSTRPDDEWGGLEEQREYVRGLENGRLDAVGGRGEWARRVDVVSMDRGDGMEGVSSSRAREAVKERNSEELERMVDGEVRAWIEREKLYLE